MRCALVAGARRAACGAHRAHSAAARLAVTAGCGADRLSIHDVSARHQAGNGPLLEHVRVDRRSCSSDFACCCESWDVHGCRTDRRGARPRPDRKARRYRPSAHDNRPRFWARRSVSDGFPAGRGGCRESDAAEGSGRGRPMVVGCRRGDGQIARKVMFFWCSPGHWLTRPSHCGCRRRYRRGGRRSFWC